MKFHKKVENDFFSLLVLSFLLGLISANAQKLPGKLIWEDDFSTAPLSSKHWSKVPRGQADWNNLMSDEDTLYTIRNHKLILRGMENTIAPKDTIRFVTGGVYSKDKISFGSGRWEIRAKLNGATGAWPAIWMVADVKDRKWPEDGEIDIMERLSHEDQVYQTVHSFYTLNREEGDHPPHSKVTSFNPDEFNTFAVEVHPDKLVFFVNDQQTLVYPKIEKKGQFPFSKHPFYLILSMQLGGEWVGEVDPKELPVEMEIDWVRFYKFEKS